MAATFPSKPDAEFVHTQMSPSASWKVVHNLGKKPAVAVIDTANSLVQGDVVYDSNDILTITFSGGFSGEAHLN